jgi:hypothetical protein
MLLHICDSCGAQCEILTKVSIELTMNGKVLVMQRFITEICHACEKSLFKYAKDTLEPVFSLVSDLKPWQVNVTR